MNNETLQKLKAMAKAASPGPWKRGSYGWVFVTGGEETYSVACCETKSGAMRNSNNNEDFIAAASPDVVLALIERIEALTDREKLYATIRQFGYTTSGQTSEIIDAILALEKK